MQHHLRIARPVSDLPRAQWMYCAGLGLCVLGRFNDHAGFDGVMLGTGDGDNGHYHFEFTHCLTHAVTPASTPEDVIVFYIPGASEWQKNCANMLAAGFRQVTSFNPYWDIQGRTFEDFDGYRVVLQNACWNNNKEM